MKDESRNEKIVRESRIISWILLVFVTLTLLFFIFAAYKTVYGRELPVLVEVNQLGEEYDGKRVVVSCWIHESKAIRGRMGGLYMDMLCAMAGSNVTVYSNKPLIPLVNKRVIVQGKYHLEGRYGGFDQEHFIAARHIIRDWKGELDG